MSESRSKIDKLHPSNKPGDRLYALVNQVIPNDIAPDEVVGPDLIWKRMNPVDKKLNPMICMILVHGYTYKERESKKFRLQYTQTLIKTGKMEWNLIPAS
ncbi:MAG: hypothetical protein AAB459_03950 [Patescibacteria group bacterium]